MVLEFNFEDQRFQNGTESQEQDDQDAPKTVNFNPHVSQQMSLQDSFEDKNLNYQARINYQTVLKKLKKQLFINSNSNINSNNMIISLFGEQDGQKSKKQFKSEKLLDYEKNRNKF